MLKSFDDFLNTITEEEFEIITKKVSDNLSVTKELTGDKNNVLGNQIYSIAISYSHELLRLYHDWLSKQL